MGLVHVLQLINGALTHIDVGSLCRVLRAVAFEFEVAVVDDAKLRWVLQRVLEVAVLACVGQSAYNTQA
jgi:hypothetical protein